MWIRIGLAMKITHCGADAFPDLVDRKPSLLVVVDTEEEFDWTKPFSREKRDISSLFESNSVHYIFDKFNVRPTYCIDQCIAENSTAVEYLSNFVRNGKCNVGTQLHPWVTPPYKEEVNDVNSYQGNLSESLERAKIQTITETIHQAFGERPQIFKAGRYGVGPNTVNLLQEFEYKIDCSFVPHTSFHQDGGPSFIGVKDQPFWFGAAPDIIEVPLSRGYSGALAGMWPTAWAGFFDSSLALQVRGPGVLSRLGLLERVTLTPEGMSVTEQKRLIRSMVARGKRVFSLTYHSSSLAPGHTPYVRSKEDLKTFLHRIESILAFFRDEIGGEFTTLDEIREQALELRTL
jgi:hypothetical protein